MSVEGENCFFKTFCTFDRTTENVEVTSSNMMGPGKFLMAFCFKEISLSNNQGQLCLASDMRRDQASVIALIPFALSKSMGMSTAGDQFLPLFLS